MTSERLQRRIEAFLDEADEAAARKDWDGVRDSVSRVLAIDPDNTEALAYRAMAEAGAPPESSTAALSTPAVPMLPESFAAGRYHVVRFLGEGGKKRVFLAHDQLLDRDVAFSLIKTDGLDDTGRERIMREAQAMGRLAHQNIVSIYDIGEHEGQPYLVQELMSGGDVEGLLEKEGGALPLAQVLRIGDAVAQGLEYAHAQGVVHRDLKPGNVWLTVDGVPKIGDFGLAVTLGRSRLTTHGMMVGTFQYMPPEQALGAEVTPRADLYSLGAMLYELVTGRPPFQGETPTAVISQHLNAPPVAPSWYSDHCPPALEALILRLLAKVPADRPASAAEVRVALAEVDPAAKSPSHSDSQANPLDRLARGVFVGRERELEQLQAALEGALQGRGSVVMLVGEPGIGKTRTVQELETYARLRGAEVYWGRTHESSGMPAYWPWIQVGGAWGATHDVVARAAQGILPNPEMVRLFPDLRRLLPGLPAPSERADESAQFLLFEAYTQFMRRESAETPWVVVLDDLHWADKPTLQLLQYVARELANMRVLVIGTYRDTDLARTHPLSEALAELNRGAGFQRVLLRGLSRAEVGEYIRQRANVPVAEAVAARIFEETEGNPFFLAQVVNLMAEEGTLTRASVSEIALPDGVRETLGRRLDRLSEEANALLQVAAIAGREFAYDTLTLLGDREPDELLQLIEEALNARVIEELGSAGHYQFTHALMQETLLGELSTTRRVRLHGQVAEALERRWGARADEYATRLAQHYAESATLTADHAAKAVHYLVRAGQEAEANFAWAEAARSYGRATTLMDESRAEAITDDPAVVLAALGRCASFANEFRVAWRATMRALDLFRSRADWRAFVDAIANVDTNWAPAPRVAALAREALTNLPPGNENARARLLGMLVGQVATSPAPASEIEGWGAELRDLMQLVVAPDVEVRLKVFESKSLRDRGEFEAAAQFGTVALDATHVSRPAYTLLAVGGQAALLAGDLSLAERLQSAALAMARRGHWSLAIDNSSAAHAGFQLLRADMSGFKRTEEGSGEARTYTWPRLRMHAAFLAGDHNRALQMLPPREMAGSVPTQLLQVTAIRALTLYRAGDASTARAEWQAVEEILPQALELSVHDHCWLVTILDELGPSVGSPFLEQFVRTRLLSPADPWSSIKAFHTSPACVARMVAQWALALGDVDDAERRYGDALGWCEREGCPIEEGRCWQGLAEIAEHRGDHLQALTCLDRAGSLFAQHEARFFLDQVIAKKEILKA